MVFGKLNWLIFIALIAIRPTAQAADQVYSEVLLKKLSQRMAKVLSESIEAQVFIEEDLSEAMKVLDKATIKWQNTLSTYPFLFSDGGKKTISLSQYYSFNTTTGQQIELVTEILFNIKRQLEGSRLSLPQARIKLFAQKFSPILLGELDECSVSISPLPALLSPTQRDEFSPKLVSLLETRGFSYESTWAENIFWMEAKERTDGGCRGNNRNIAELKLVLVNIKLQKSEIIAEVSAHSCGYSTGHMDEAIQKLIKQMKKQTPKCNRAFRTF